MWTWIWSHYISTLWVPLGAYSMFLILRTCRLPTTSALLSKTWFTFFLWFLNDLASSADWPCAHLTLLNFGINTAGMFHIILLLMGAFLTSLLVKIGSCIDLLPFLSTIITILTTKLIVATLLFCKHAFLCRNYIGTSIDTSGTIDRW